MLAASIDAILYVTGAVTALAGLTVVLAPKPLLRLVFGVVTVDGALLFFVRHWGVLLFVVGALTVAAGPLPALRGPVLSAAAIEKAAIAGLVCIGPLKRTPGMTAVAIVDGLCALIYAAYLFGG